VFSASAAYDVTILGAGLCGKAAAMQLAAAGLRVVCIEPEEVIQQAVGESLDWSAPDLLNALGLPMEDLVIGGLATWKRHVTVKLRDGGSEHYVPGAWLAEAPFRVELRTMHVDRLRLDEELLKRTLASGVTVVRDSVVRAERDGDRVIAVNTAGGARFSSPWFIDASGFASSLLPREFDLPAIHFGPAKVAIWTYFAISELVEGTTLYMEPLRAEYLDWVWEIPIGPQVVSVGYVTTGAAMKARREQGLGVEDIFRRQLHEYPHFEALLQAGALGPCNVTAFRSRVYDGVAGPNWFVAGEAASMVDPITANGVTAALRHAAEASALILKYRTRRALPLRTRIAYNHRILQMAKFFNIGIETVLYEPAVRNRIGARASGTVYTTPAWSMNVVYARLKPKGIAKTYLLGLVLGFWRACAWIFSEYCKRMPRAAQSAG
jgi:flavin-dependent dehydrogenase